MTKPALLPSQMDARISMGPFAFPLPANVTDAIGKTDKLFNLMLDFDPVQLDEPPVVRTRYGDLSVVRLARSKEVERVAATDPEAARALRQAEAQLKDHLDWIFEAWNASRTRIWEAVAAAEQLAAEQLYRYLMANLAMVADERDRYRRPSPGPGPRDLMWVASRRVQAARERANVDELKTASIVVDGVALALTVRAIVGSIDRGDLFMDAQAREQLAYAAGLQSEAQRQLSQGVTEYLTVLRKEAEEFPSLLILDHSDPFEDEDEAMAAVSEALDRAAEAIGGLCRSAVNGRTIRETLSQVTDLVEDIAGASRVSVWKLPFFLDRGLGEMSPRDANLVRRIRRAAAEAERGSAIAHAIALGGMDVAMMAAAVTGPVGVGTAFLWAVATLGRTLHEYSQLTDLYRASIDPSLLLLGEEHGPASQLGIVFDVLGLWV